MPVRKILQYPHPLLREVCRPVDEIDDEVRIHIRNLVDTMRASPGVALAAPQIGVPRRIIAVDVTARCPGAGLIVLVNPEIVAKGRMKTVREGCLSIPQYTADIRRAETVKVRGLNSEGKEVFIESSGLEAVALQHEVDHLDGILFIDRVESIRSLFRRKKPGP